MRLRVRKQVKALLSQEGLTQKKLANLLTEKLGKKYTQTGLAQKMSRGSLSYNEVMVIAEILGYDVQYIKEIK